MVSRQSHLVLETSDRVYAELVEPNLGLARSLALRYTGRGLDYEDVYQEAWIGLIRAANTFDETRGVQFSTHATWCICDAIWRVLKEQRIIGRGSAARVLPPLSLNAPVDEDEFLCLADVIAGPVASDPLYVVEQADNTPSLQMLLEQLTPREQLVICLCYGIGGGPSWSFAGVGRLLGITRQAVEQTKQRACRKLRTLLTQPMPRSKHSQNSVKVQPHSASVPPQIRAPRRQNRKQRIEERRREEQHPQMRRRRGSTSHSSHNTSRRQDREQRTKEQRRTRHTNTPGRSVGRPKKPLSERSTHISYILQPAFCGKERCRKCKERVGHGPYWHAYQLIDGHLKHTYIGKQAPREVQQRDEEGSLVTSFSREREEQQ